MTHAKPAPKKRGRPPKAASVSGPQPPAEQPPAEASATILGVSSTVAHRPLSLLQVQDSADLDALLVNPALSSLVVARLDSHTVLVVPGRDKALLEQLRKAGHTPKVMSGEH